MNAMNPHGESTSKRPRRDKYISRACGACQRRKSKCSGHDPCLSCQGRDLICIYNTEKRRPRKSTSDVQRRISTRTATIPDERRDSPSPEPLGYIAPPSPSLETIEEVHGPEPSCSRLVHARPSPGPLRTMATLYRPVGWDLNRMSLRSQISEARALFKSREDPGSVQDEASPNRGEKYSIELPAFSEIQESLHVFFENTKIQYPVIDPESAEARIRKILEYLQYPSCGLKIDVDYVAAPTVALLCIMIAIAELNGDTTSPSNGNDRAMVFRNHARRLLQFFEFLPPNLEILRCHTMITIYLLHADFLDLALQSNAVTVHLAMALQLHRRSPSFRKGSDSYDQNLWWTIYILDRNIACLGGVPYLIRDEEIDAPQPTRDGRFEKFSSVTYIYRPSEHDEQSGPSERSLHQDATYLEILAHLGRLWARIWNSLVTDSSELDCQWQTTEILDAQIRILQQRLPPSLTWESPSSLGRDLVKEEENAMQRQLIVLMRINTLRLLIRKKSTSNCSCLDRKSPHCDGATISAQTIKAIADLSTHHEALLRIGHPISTTLVQCILHLVNTIKDSALGSGTELASDSVVSAYQILINLSEHCISARNAVETLDAAFFRHDGSIRPPAPHCATAILPQSSDSSQRAGLENTHAQGLGQTETQKNVSTSTEQSHRANDLFNYLQQSYESLDRLLPTTIPNA